MISFSLCFHLYNWLLKIESQKATIKEERDLMPGVSEEVLFYMICNTYIIFFPVGRFIINENMKPMGSNSTHFISYHNIKVKNVDLLEDAWGFNSEFVDVIRLLGKIKPVPRKRLTSQLVEKIRKQY